MKKWKFIAISDTHLGEDSSVLSYKPGRSHLFEALRSKLGDGSDKKFQIEELVLVGDVPDRTLSSTSQVMTQTYDLMKTWFAAAEIGRVVYLPGNHDHTLWTEYVQKQGLKDKISASPEGDLVLARGDYSKAQTATELLSMLFGYSESGTSESLWRDLNEKKQVELCFANPVYAKAVGSRTYVFTHGTHFRSDVMGGAWRKLLDYLEVDTFAGDIEVDTTQTLEGAVDLRDLEHRATPFVDTLWPSSKDQATRQYDKLWYFLSSIGGKFKRHPRHTPEEHAIFSLAQLQALDSRRIRRIDDKNDTVGRMRKQFLPLLSTYLKQHQFADHPLTLVYGDTHEGGWGTTKLGSTNINLYNTGSWVAHNDKDHPDCHIFGVDENNEEHLLDVTFRGVKVGTKPIVEVAARESEHRKERISKITRFFLDRLF